MSWDNPALSTMQGLEPGPAAPHDFVQTLLGNFMLNLFHRSKITCGSDWWIKKTDILDDYLEVISLENLQKLKDYCGTANIEILLERANFICSNPNSLYYKINYLKLISYRAEQLQKLDYIKSIGWRTIYAEQSSGLLFLPKNKFFFTNDENNFGVDNNQPRIPLIYISRKRKTREEHFVTTNTCCPICQEELYSISSFEDHMQHHFDNTNLKMLSTRKNGYPIFNISYRQCPNSHVFFFEFETTLRDLIIENIIFVQKNSYFYVQGLPYKLPENGKSNFFVDSNLFFLHVEQPVFVICYFEEQKEFRMIEQYHFMRSEALPITSFTVQPLKKHIPLPKEKLFQKTLFLEEYLPTKEIHQALKHGSYYEKLKKVSRAFLNYVNEERKIQPHNIVPSLNILLQIEDADTIQQYLSLVHHNVQLTLSNEEYSFELKYERDLEQKLIIAQCDEIILTSRTYMTQWNDFVTTHTRSKLNEVFKLYVGEIVSVNHRCVSFKCRKSLDLNDTYKITYRPCRNNIRYQYRSLYLLNHNMHFLKDFLFPNVVKRSEPLSTVNLNLYNKNMNPEQLQAVRNIAEGPRKDATYIIFGPPGTGKTMTVVESIMQLLEKPDTKIVVTAPSNSACDEIAIRLLKYLERRERAMIRIYSRSSETRLEEIDHDLLQHSNMYNGQFYPAIETLQQYRIVICTLSVIANLSMGHFGYKGYSHLFIDEAAAAMEPEVLVAITAVVSPTTRLIISGDYKQLGPVLRSNRAEELGLGISLMERLLKRDCYRVDANTGDYDRTIQTRLIRNYRSHPEIVKLFSGLYYNHSLEAHAKLDNVSWGKVWHHTHNKDYPILFHAVYHPSETDYYTYSLYNHMELHTVLEYVKDFMHFGINGNPVQQSDIGIISPYKTQYKLIRNELNKRDWFNIETGAVETFQGKEKQIILVSFVRSATGSLGFLDSSRRLNVTLSRAKSILVLIGNPLNLGLHAEIKYIIVECQRHGTYIESPFTNPSNELTDYYPNYQNMPSSFIPNQAQNNYIVSESENDNHQVVDNDYNDFETLMRYIIENNILLSNLTGDQEHLIANEDNNLGKNNDNNITDNAKTHKEVPSQEVLKTEFDDQTSGQNSMLRAESFSEQQIKCTQNSADESTNYFMTKVPNMLIHSKEISPAVTANDNLKDSEVESVAEQCDTETQHLETLAKSINDNLNIAIHSTSTTENPQAVTATDNSEVESVAEQCDAETRNLETLAKSINENLNIAIHTTSTTENPQAVTANDNLKDSEVESVAEQCHAETQNLETLGKSIKENLNIPMHTTSTTENPQAVTATDNSEVESVAEKCDAETRNLETLAKSINENLNIAIHTTSTTENLPAVTANDNLKDSEVESVAEQCHAETQNLETLGKSIKENLNIPMHTTSTTENPQAVIVNDNLIASEVESAAEQCDAETQNLDTLANCTKDNLNIPIHTTSTTENPPAVIANDNLKDSEVESVAEQCDAETRNLETLAKSINENLNIAIHTTSTTENPQAVTANDNLKDSEVESVAEQCHAETQNLETLGKSIKENLNIPMHTTSTTENPQAVTATNNSEVESVAEQCDAETRNLETLAKSINENLNIAIHTTSTTENPQAVTATDNSEVESVAEQCDAETRNLETLAKSINENLNIAIHTTNTTENPQAVTANDNLKDSEVESVAEQCHAETQNLETLGKSIKENLNIPMHTTSTTENPPEVTANDNLIASEVESAAEQCDAETQNLDTLANCTKDNLNIPIHTTSTTENPPAVIVNDNLIDSEVESAAEQCDAETQNLETLGKSIKENLNIPIHTISTTENPPAVIANDNLKDSEVESVAEQCDAETQNLETFGKSIKENLNIPIHTFSTTENPQAVIVNDNLIDSEVESAAEQCDAETQNLETLGKSIKENLNIPIHTISTTENPQAVIVNDNLKDSEVASATEQYDAETQNLDTLANSTNDNLNIPMHTTSTTENPPAVTANDNLKDSEVESVAEKCDADTQNLETLGKSIKENLNIPTHTISTTENPQAVIVNDNLIASEVESAAEQYDAETQNLDTLANSTNDNLNIPMHTTSTTENPPAVIANDNLKDSEVESVAEQCDADTQNLETLGKSIKENLNIPMHTTSTTENPQAVIVNDNLIASEVESAAEQCDAETQNLETLGKSIKENLNIPIHTISTTENPPALTANDNLKDSEVESVAEQCDTETQHLETLAKSINDNLNIAIHTTSTTENPQAVTANDNLKDSEVESVAEQCHAETQNLDTLANCTKDNLNIPIHTTSTTENPPAVIANDNLKDSEVESVAEKCDADTQNLETLGKSIKENLNIPMHTTSTTENPPEVTANDNLIASEVESAAEQCDAETQNLDTLANCTKDNLNIPIHTTSTTENPPAVIANDNLKDSEVESVAEQCDAETQNLETFGKSIKENLNIPIHIISTTENPQAVIVNDNLIDSEVENAAEQCDAETQNLETLGKSIKENLNIPIHTISTTENPQAVIVNDNLKDSEVARATEQYDAETQNLETLGKSIKENLNIPTHTISTTENPQAVIVNDNLIASEVESAAEQYDAETQNLETLGKSIKENLNIPIHTISTTENPQAVIVNDNLKDSEVESAGEQCDTETQNLETLGKSIKENFNIPIHTSSTIENPPAVTANDNLKDSEVESVAEQCDAETQNLETFTKSINKNLNIPIHTISTTENPQAVTAIDNLKDSEVESAADQYDAETQNLDTLANSTNDNLNIPMHTTSTTENPPAVTANDNLKDSEVESVAEQSDTETQNSETLQRLIFQCLKLLRTKIHQL